MSNESLMNILSADVIVDEGENIIASTTDRIYFKPLDMVLMAGVIPCDECYFRNVKNPNWPCYVGSHVITGAWEPCGYYVPGSQNE